MKLIFILISLLSVGCGKGLDAPPQNAPAIMGTPCDLLRNEDENWVYRCSGMPTCSSIIYMNSAGIVQKTCCDNGSESCS